MTNYKLLPTVCCGPETEDEGSGCCGGGGCC